MKTSALFALPLSLALALSACGAPAAAPAPESAASQSAATESAAAPEASPAPAPAGTEVPPPPVALDSREWKSDHVLLALESGEYEAGEDNLPVGFSLPAEAEAFFLTGYAEEFGPEVLPLMRYDIAAGDVNGDGARDYIVSALPQAMYFGNSPAPAYFFHSQPGGGYRMAYFSLAQPVYRFLDTGENGLPDLLFFSSGRTLSYDGASAYEFSDGSPESRSYNLLSSKPEADGSALRVPVCLNYGLPENCCIAAYLKSEADRLEEAAVWLTMPDGSRAFTGSEGFSLWDCGADLRLRDGAALGEDELLFPDEIQFVPAE